MENPIEPEEIRSVNLESTRRHYRDDRPVGSGWWYVWLIPLSLLYFFGASQIANEASRPGPVPVDGMVTFFFMALAWPFLAAFLLLVIKGVMNIHGVQARILAILMWIASCAAPFIVVSLDIHGLL